MERTWESLQAEDQHGQRPKVGKSQRFENGRNQIVGSLVWKEVR